MRIGKHIVPDYATIRDIKYWARAAIIKSVNYKSYKKGKGVIVVYLNTQDIQTYAYLTPDDVIKMESAYVFDRCDLHDTFERLGVQVNHEFLY